MRSRGLSLLEAIISIFILTGGSLACFTLLLQAFRYQGRTQHVSDATIAGEQMMESLRRWALDPANFDNQWKIYSDQDLPSINPPGFTCHLTVSPLKAPGDVLTPCFRLVTIEVRDSQRVVTRLTGQIGSPLRKPEGVQIFPAQSVRLQPDQQTQFWAYLLDTNSKPIPGVSFNWTLLPEGPPEVPGDGTVERAGADRVTLTHLVYGPTPPDPNKLYTPGKVRVHASCRYRASIYEADSALVELLPPP
ncbi:hypothetical protein JST97_25190 [bacterium]|nr:hypothetical protein [bacterium]